MPPHEPDRLLRALDELEAVLDANVERAQRMKRRIAEIRESRELGRSYREIVPRERRPLILQLLRESAAELERAGQLVRRSEAQALYDEGLTMEQIADLFAVTRQRVSALLRGARRDGGG